MIDLEAYEQVPIGYWVEARLGRDFAEIPVERYWKDYDEYPESRPSAYPAQFDVQTWAVIVAVEDGERVGGAIVAWRSPDFDMLEGRDDLAVLVDLRVRPRSWGRGVGKQLFASAAEWAREKGCTEFRVETQDTNVPACRFYRAMGCTLHSWEEGAYGPEVNEAKLLWTKGLSPTL
jgi:GNAT superfamily N-acetyltransferase